MARFSVKICLIEYLLQEFVCKIGLIGWKTTVLTLQKAISIVPQIGKVLLYSNPNVRNIKKF